jgi:hypothetical protein
MPDQLGRSGSNLRRVTRTMELRSRLRRATTVIESMDAIGVAPRDRSLWETYKHYACAIGGVLVGGISVLIGTALLDGSRAASLDESAKMRSPMVIAVDRALAQAEQLITILETIVGQRIGQRKSESQFEEHEGKKEYQNCLENCAKSVRIEDESDKWLLINCRNECISQYSKRVKGIQKRHMDSD